MTTTWSPPLTRGETQARARHAIYLEEGGMPLEQAMQEGDLLIASRRAFGRETPFEASSPDPYDKRW